ncbi:MAG TPA: ATP-binding cassette domain-containing protein [Streptosporangiaceae bacterium]
MATERPPPLLRAESVAAGYGAGLVVREVTVSAGRGEIVTILGPNGSGKSTLLKALAGLLPVRSGQVWLGGTDLAGLPGEARARRGLAYLPQEREVFASLTVRENLLMGGYHLGRAERKAALARVHEAYPVLGPLDGTAAGRLSGGERKTVAMARLMMSSPSVVLLDEPTANLAPVPSAELLARDVAALAAAGVAVILVEQRAAAAIAVSGWAYVLVGGAVEVQGPAAEVGARDLGAVFLGAAAGDGPDGNGPAGHHPDGGDPDSVSPAGDGPGGAGGAAT